MPTHSALAVALEQPNRVDDSTRAVHVPLCRREIAVCSKLLNRRRRGAAHREVRTDFTTEQAHFDADNAEGVISYPR
jgi:hypothetical protein